MMIKVESSKIVLFEAHIVIAVKVAQFVHNPCIASIRSGSKLSQALGPAGSYGTVRSSYVGIMLQSHSVELVPKTMGLGTVESVA
eukprot:1100631-Rhodomonas_salina.1